LRLQGQFKQNEMWALAHLWYPRIYVQCVQNPTKSANRK
jgi:hypothetical protein